MQTTIRDSLADNEPVRVSWLRRAVLHEHGVSITRHKMYRIMKRVLKANYGTARILIKDNFDPDSTESKSKRATFLRAYAEALRLQKAGEAVIVFYDETYINTGHAATMTWYLDKSKRRLGGKGKRLIVLHALTKDGPVVCRDADGNYIELTEAQNADLKTAHRTAEMIYEAKKAEGDYHDSMDSDTYLAWLEYRLFPTLRALYPGKRIIAIKDNASYHKAHPKRPNGKDWQSISALKNKTEMAELCDDWEIKDMWVRRPPQGQPFSENPQTRLRQGGYVDKKIERKDFLRRFPSGPGANELRALLQTRSLEHPEYFETLADQMFRQLSLEDNPNGVPLFCLCVWWYCVVSVWFVRICVHTVRCVDHVFGVLCGQIRRGTTRFLPRPTRGMIAKSPNCGGPTPRTM